MFRNGMIGSTILLLAAPALAGSINLTAQVMVEKRVAGADGTIRIELARADRVVPGDRIIYVIEYRNSGTTAASNLVVANPVPLGLTYAGAAPGMVAPEVSNDGKTFAPIAELRVRGADGILRIAVPLDIRSVRWRLTGPIAPGASGKVAFCVKLT